METQILSISLKDYRKELDELRASLLSLEKGSEAYQKTVNDIKAKQQQLNEVMSIGKKDTDALEGSYNALQQQMTALKKEWRATNDEAKRNELGKQINEMDAELKELDATIGQFQRSVGNYAIAGKSMSATIKENEAALAAMEDKTTEAYKKLFEETAKLYDKRADLKQAIKNEADDAKALNTIVDVAKLGTAAFGVWQSAAAMFGVENEKVVESIQKLQVATTMLSSLKEIQLALFDKGSRIYQLYTKVIGAFTVAKKAETVATKEDIAAKEADAIATNHATVATKAFRAAIIATGIGAFVVILGELIANWEKIKNLLPKVNEETEDYSDAVEHLKDIQESYNHGIDNEIKLMKAQGASEKQIIEYKIKQTQALQNEIQMKILDIRTTNKQLEALNAYQIFAAKAFKKILQAGTLAFKGIATLSDKVFGSHLAEGLDNLIDKATNGFSKLLDIGDSKKIAKNNKIIEELEGQLGGVNQQLTDLSVDLQVAELQTDKNTKATKNLKNALKELAEQQKKQAEALRQVIDDDAEYLKLQAQLEKAQGKLSDKEYEQRLVGIDKARIDSLNELAERYKDNAELRVKYENMAAVEAMKLEISEAEKASEQIKKKITDSFNDTVNQIRGRVDSQSARAEYGADMSAINVQGDDNPFTKRKSEAQQLIEIEIKLAQDLFNIREQGRIDERAAVAKQYDELIAAATGNNEEMERLAKAKADAIGAIEEESAQDRMGLEVKVATEQKKLREADKKELMSWAKKQNQTMQNYASAFSDILGQVGEAMQMNIEQKVKNGEITDEEAEKEFEKVKGVQIATTWINTLAGGAAAFLKSVEQFGWIPGAIIGAAGMAASIALGVAQTNAIKATTFGNGGSGGGGGAATVPDVSVAPLLNEELDSQSMTALNTEQIANQNGEKRVYILQSDIHSSEEQVSVRQSNTTF